MNWISTRFKMPDPGTMIVKRWKSGSVWAGLYSGGAKEGSFDEWIPLPP